MRERGLSPDRIVLQHPFGRPFWHDEEGISQVAEEQQMTQWEAFERDVSEALAGDGQAALPPGLLTTLFELLVGIVKDRCLSGASGAATIASPTTYQRRVFDRRIREELMQSGETRKAAKDATPRLSAAVLKATAQRGEAGCQALLDEIEGQVPVDWFMGW